MRHLLIPFGIKPKVREVNPYGDMFARALAACIDVFVLMLLFYDFFFWMDQKYFPHTGVFFLDFYKGAVDDEARRALIVEWFTHSAVQVFFFGLAIVGSYIAFGTTPGKWLVGLKVVRHGTHEPLSRGRHVLRFLAYIPACAPLMLGMLWIGFNKQRRGWHDYIADTVVLNLRPSGWYWEKTKQGWRWLRAKSKKNK